MHRGGDASSTRRGQARDYGFADRALALRERAGLTQDDLAALLGVTSRAVQTWEAGDSYPGAERLRQLIALYLERGIFTVGREQEEAEELWAIAREKAARRTTPFDPRWFAALRPPGGGGDTAVPLPPLPAASALPPPRYDWGEAPATPPHLYGRAEELATLARWVREERCRVVAVVGAGGVGKTALAIQLAHEVAPEVAVVYWRSLRNAPTADEWLAGAIGSLSAGQAVVPAGFDARLDVPLELLHHQRVLLVLDNLESVLEPGARHVRYRAGYEGYGEVVRRLAESPHQGCLLLTSREQPLRADAAVRALHLDGLSVEAGQLLLGARDLVGDPVAWWALVERYAGNPLALSIVGETIVGVFRGDIAVFLAQGMAVYGGIRQLLDEQVARLSAVEQTILTWLAVEREPVGFAGLAADLGPEIERGAVVEGVEALLRRSLLERGTAGTYSLQPVVLEYATMRLVSALAEEIVAGKVALLSGQPLLKATAKDYVRQSQERLIVQPLLNNLAGSLVGKDAVEERLLALLARWRRRPPGEQGYGPGNVVNLLRLLRGDLRGLDLSWLVLRHAYLPGVEAQDASLAHAYLSEAVLAEAYNFLTSVTLSAHGTYLAAGTDTGEVYLWRVADRTLLLAATGHRSPIASVALSADGRLLASGSFDGTVRLWETGSGQLLATLQGHTGAVWGVALSRDGRLVASGSFDQTIKLWETDAGRLLATLQGHSGPVAGVALSADGRLLASGSFDGTVKLWEAEAGQLLATLQGHTGAVRGVALSGDGRFVASGGVDETVRLWETESGHPVATLPGHVNGVRGVALSGDGQLVASGSADGSVRLWEAPSGRPLATLRDHAAGVEGVALSGDGRFLASASIDGAARLWEADPQAGSPVRLVATLQGHASAVPGGALSEDGRLVASGGADGTIRLWETGSGQLLATLLGHTGTVWWVALSGDGRLVASGGFDGTVRLWEASSGQPLAILPGHVRGVEGVALSGDGRLVVSGSVDGTVRFWEASSGQPLAVLREHTGGVLAVALTGDGRLAASGSFDGTVRLWEAPGGQPLATLRGHTGGVEGVALSKDGRLVASSSYDGTVRLWEAPSGQPLAILHGHTAAVRSIALSGDGRLAVSSSYDGTARVWDVRGGICLRILRGDRRYERLDMTGLTGVTPAQRATLLALGAVEGARAQVAPVDPVGALPSPPTLPVPASAPGTAAPRPSTNLPPARTTFVGRTAEVASLTRALDPTITQDTRLLTLTGMAGCGKTRLTLALAAAVAEAYAGGTWLVELAPLPAGSATDPTAVLAATLAALGLPEQPGEAPLDTLVARLQRSRTLLILDNCEHVVAACASVVTHLLAACPTLQILASSQQALGIAQETVRPVAPLTLPLHPADGVAREAVHLLGQSEAVQLFVERAQSVQPGFALTAQNATAVGAICRRLDGLPLAIELAAARLGVLPLEEILVRLDDRFRLLRRGGHTNADRHQALQATMDWSYALLDPDGQAVLRRLAVFVGGWDVAAAEAVCAGEEVAAGTVLDLLDELLDRSLLYVHVTGGVPRSGMLETVRQYGLQQLERTGELAAVRERYLQWCVTLAEQAASAMTGPEQSAWLGRLEREHDNLRAALQWALDRDLRLPGLRLAAGLWRFWRTRRGHLSEGRRWLAALLALPGDEDDATSMALRASALEGAAWLAEDEHDFAQASALFAQSDTLRRVLGQDERATGLLINEAMAARAGGDYAPATALLEECLARHRARGNRESINHGGLGLSLSRLALVLAEQGAYAQATALYEECVALHRELHDREGEGYALQGQGDVARDQGDPGRVRVYCEESLALFREMGHTLAGFALNNLALAACLDGDLALAASRARESEALFRELQAEPNLAEVLVTVGRVKGAQGQMAAARASLAEALRLAWARGPRWVVAAVLEELGVLAVRQGQEREGVTLLAAAARLREVMGAPIRPADRRALDGALATAEATLGPTTYAETWAVGRMLPLEQIAARAGDDP